MCSDSDFGAEGEFWAKRGVEIVRKDFGVVDLKRVRVVGRTAAARGRRRSEFILKNGLVNSESII